MPGTPPILLLLLLGALCARPARAGSHSHRCFYSSLSEERPGIPRFTAVAYADDVEIEAYSSASRRYEPRAPWMERVVESEPQYWERNTENLRGWEAGSRADVRTVMGRHNQTAGLHVFQVMYVCELREDGSIGGSFQYAYDGHDFLSLDKENLKYTAAMDAARVTANRWDQEGIVAQRYKAFLEQECIEWLRKYLDYGKASLLRRVPPQTMISRRKTDTATTLSCYAYGFYPREIVVKWMRNEVEVDWKTKIILPNTDGTYQIRITLDLPKGHNEKNYSCLVEHIGLKDIITKVYEEKSGTPYTWIIVGVIAVVILVTFVTAVVIWKRKRADKSKTAVNQDKNLYTAVETNQIAGPDSSCSTNSV